MDTERSDRRRFAGDLRWIVPLWLVMAIGFGVFVGVSDDARAGLETAGFMVLLAVALTPLIWLRYSGGHIGHRGDGWAALKRVGLAISWAVGVLVVSVAVLSALD